MKKNVIIIYIFIFIFCSIIAVYFRLYPYFLTKQTIESSNHKANLIVLYQIKQNIKKTINEQFPNKDKKRKEELEEEYLRELLKKNKKNFEESVKSVKKKLSLDENTSGRSKFYLLGSDSFYYYGLTNQLLLTGSFTKDINNIYFLDSLMTAPFGQWQVFNLHPYVGLWIHNILSIFNPSIDLMFSVSLTSIFLVVISIIIFLMIAYFFKLSYFSSFIGCSFLILSPVYFRRSAFGWYDTDPYNIIFSLLIIGSMFFSLFFISKNKKFTYKHLIYFLLPVFFLSVYSLFWQGWILLLFMCLILLITSVLFNYFCKRIFSNNLLLLLFISLFIGIFFFLSLFSGYQSLFSHLKETSIIIKNFFSSKISLWPDIFLSVGELHKSSNSSIIAQLGNIFFIIALIYFIYLIVKLIRKKEYTFYTFCLMSLLILIIFLWSISLTSLRFSLFLLPVMCFVVSICLNEIFNILKKKFPDKESIFFIICIFFVFLLVINLHLKIERYLNPIYNDGWNKSMGMIKNNTEEDSIINTWWPPGHFIKAIANRRVLLMVQQ